MIYRTLSVTYGVKIDLANSNPETSVTYTDDAVGFDKSYMDFTNDTFVYGSWQDKFPFNQVRPCLFKDGAVVKYLNPDNYAKDVDGNDVVITGADGDVMIEIPKVYYRLHKDENYQYIQISDTAQEGFCCLAHTYKGVEKDKVYIGAYQSYYEKGELNERNSSQGLLVELVLLAQNLLITGEIMLTLKAKDTKTSTGIYLYCFNVYLQYNLKILIRKLLWATVGVIVVVSQLVEV